MLHLASHVKSNNLASFDTFCDKTPAPKLLPPYFYILKLFDNVVRQASVQQFFTSLTILFAEF